VTGWLLNLAYVALLTALSPIIIWRMITQGKYRDGWREKLLGELPRIQGSRPRVWLHAVSVGEVLQLKTIVAALRAERPDHDFVITTTTITGLDVAKRSFPEETVCYFPLDFTWAVRRALSRIAPAALVLVELELWPNLIREADRRNIPVVLINGRLSAKSFRGYRKIRFLLRHILAKFHTIAVQNDTYAQRIQQLGAPPERLQITGSIKFDAVRTNRDNEQTAEIRRSFGIGQDELVFIAGSTQSPEEEIALKTYAALREEFSNLRLVLVPRHKERFEEVARLVTARGFGLIRRSEISAIAPPNHGSTEPPVLLLDTLGELSACWGLADIAFVGGSLTNRGGQNMIEPAGYGAAVLFGPNTRNFRDVVEILLKQNAACVVTDAADLTHRVRALLQLESTRHEMGRRAQELVLSQQGATQRTVELINAALPPVREQSDSGESQAA